MFGSILGEVVDFAGEDFLKIAVNAKILKNEMPGSQGHLESPRLRVGLDGGRNWHSVRCGRDPGGGTVSGSRF